MFWRRDATPSIAHHLAIAASLGHVRLLVQPAPVRLNGMAVNVSRTDSARIRVADSIVWPGELALLGPTRRTLMNKCEPTPCLRCVSSWGWISPNVMHHDAYSGHAFAHRQYGFVFADQCALLLSC